MPCCQKNTTSKPCSTTAKANTSALPPVDHKAIFDLRCVGQSGEHFIVEPNQNSLKFYATFPIQQQAQADE